MNKLLILLVFSLVLFAVSFGCGKKEKNDDLFFFMGTGTGTGTSTGTSTSTAGTVAGPIEFSTDSTLVYDPKLGGSPEAKIAFTVTASGSFTGDIVITDGTSTVRSLMSAGSITGNQLTEILWDGKADNGSIVQPGAYVVDVSINSNPVATLTYNCHIVRLAIVKMAFESPGVQAVEFPLKYNRRSAVDVTDFTVSDGASFATDVVWQNIEADNTNGTPRMMPLPWTGSAEYPQNYTATTFNYPAAYLMGSKMQMKVEMGNTSRLPNGTIAGVGYPIVNLPIRIVGDYVGFPIICEDSQDISSGQVYTLETEATLPATVGKRNEVFAISFEYMDGGVWQPVPGTQTTSHTVYRTGGIPTDSSLYQTEPDHDKCYIKVLDLTCTWATGETTADDIFTKIWTNLWDIENPSWTYEHALPGGFKMVDLLDNHWGRCGAWSLFQLTCNGYHGLEGKQIGLFPRNDHVQGMANGTNETGRIFVEVFETTDGQGDPDNLLTKFTDHAVIFYNGRYYDPSYEHLTSPAKDGFASAFECENFGLEGYWEGTGQVLMYSGISYKILWPTSEGTLIHNNLGYMEVHEYQMDF